MPQGSVRNQLAAHNLLLSGHADFDVPSSVVRFLRLTPWMFPASRLARLASGRTVRQDFTVPGHGALIANASVDLTGETCLRTNLVTKHVLDALAAGQVVEIVSDNLSAVETIPFMLAGHGCAHVGTLHLEGIWKIYARKLHADDGSKGT